MSAPFKTFCMPWMLPTNGCNKIMIRTADTDACLWQKLYHFTSHKVADAFGPENASICEGAQEMGPILQNYIFEKFMVKLCILIT